MASHASSYYTLAEVARRLRISVKTVRRYVREGRLAAVRLGREYRVSAEALIEFLKNSTTRR